MAMSILFKFLTLKWDISRVIWHIKVNNGSFFYIFHALSFFRPEFPFKSFAEKFITAEELVFTAVRHLYENTKAANLRRDDRKKKD